MAIKLDVILGILIIISVILGVLSPIVVYVKKPSISEGEDLLSLISTDFFSRRAKLVETLAYNVNEPFTIKIDVSAGGVSVEESSNPNKIFVEVLESEMTFMLFIKSNEKKSYNVSFENNNLIISSNGYFIKIMVPSIYFTELYGKVSGGGISTDIKASMLKLIDLDISGGGISTKISDLGNSSIRINISGGGLEGEISYREYVGEASITIIVNGGGIRLDVEDVGAKVKAKVDLSGGGSVIEINGKEILKISGSGSKEYVEPDYENANKKLNISIEVSGGGANIGIRT